MIETHTLYVVIGKVAVASSPPLTLALVKVITVQWEVFCILHFKMYDSMITMNHDFC